MLTASGSFTKASGDLTTEVLATGFKPASVWVLYHETSTADAHQGRGLATDSLQQAQQSGSYYDQNGVSSSRTQWSRYNGICRMATTGNGAIYKATATLDATSWSFVPSVSELDIEVFWWAIDDAAAVGSSFDTHSFNVGGTWDYHHNDAAFVADFAGQLIADVETFSSDVGLDHAVISLALGATASGYLQSGRNQQNSRATSSGGTGFSDSTDGGYVGPARNYNTYNRQNANAVLTGAAELNSSIADSVDVVIIDPGNSSNRPRPFMALGGRGDGLAGIGRFQLNATDGVQQIRGLGFRPDFIFANCQLGKTALDAGTNFVFQQPGGFSDGVYTDEGQQAVACVQHGGSTSAVAISTSPNLIDFTSYYAGTAQVTALDDDGFDITISGTGGIQHEVLFFAFGEAGAAETQLDADAVTLSWTSTEADVSAAGTLSVEEVTLAWASTDADIESISELDVDNLFFDWFATNADIQTAGSVSAEPVTFGWSLTDVDVSADGVPLNSENVVWNFTATPVVVQPIEVALGADAGTLQWSSDEADVVPAGALALDPVTLNWSSPDAVVLSEEQSLSLEMALLSWSDTQAVVLDDANLVNTENVSFGFTSTDASIVNEQVTGEPVTLGWSSPAVNVFVEFDVTYAFLVQVQKPVSTIVEVASAKRGPRTSTT